MSLTVNRRQRVEGGTILGWNPDEQCDRDVAVIRVDAEDGEAICTVVAFAAHPVVVGPDVPEASSDFVGPLREHVRRWTGGECVFLPGLRGQHRPVRVVPHESPARSGSSASGSRSPRSRRAPLRRLEPTRPRTGAVRLRHPDGDLASTATRASRRT